MTYRWIQPDKERFQHPKKNPSKPIPTATLSGGVFAVDKKFFLEFGGFDKGFEQWGGENMELSFKVSYRVHDVIYDVVVTRDLWRRS